MTDLIQSLTADMGTTPHQARLIAARLLTHVEGGLRQTFGALPADAFHRRVLDFRAWDTGADGQADAGEADAIGVDATLVEILGHIGVDPVKAGIALPPFGAYLKSTLPPDLFRLVLQVAPFLAMAAPERHPGFVPPSAPPLFGA
jgi:hypothetical protein